MRSSLRAVPVLILLAISACGSTTDESAGTDPPATPAPVTDPPSTEPPITEPPVTEPPATEPPATEPATTDPPATTSAPTTIAPEAIVVGAPDGEGIIDVTIDGALLDPLHDSFTAGDDPFYLVHTQQDDIFVSVEMYTVFGSGWTGELGTFPADCTTHGLCVYLDPDGVGPLTGGGPGEGTLTITQLDGGTIVTIDEVTIEATDGQVYRLRDVTLTG